MFALKSNKYTEYESLVKRWFNQNHFTTPSAQFLYHVPTQSKITPASLKMMMRGLPGVNKQAPAADLETLADTIMSADFFLDCGSFICLVDITRSIYSPCLQSKLLKKQEIMTRRLYRCVDQNIGLRWYDVNTKKHVYKPILKGLVIALDYMTSLSIDKVLDVLDSNNHKCEVISFFNKEVI